MNDFVEKTVDTTGSISSSRVISAIAQTPINVEGVKYLPVCTTRSVNAAGTANPQEDGKIILYNLTTAGQAPIEIANHNYKCKTLTAMGGNLVVAGNHVTQVMNQEEIAAVVSGAQPTPKMLYTDEIYNHIRWVLHTASGVCKSSRCASTISKCSGQPHRIYSDATRSTDLWRGDGKPRECSRF